MQPEVMIGRKRKTAAIVVVNYNGGRHVAELVAHLARQTVRDFELILVDNGSQDASAAGFEAAAHAHGMAVRILAPGRNVGFAAGCNLGGQATEADHLVLLNMDTRPEPEWLARLLEGYETARRGGDTQVTMVAAKMLRAQRPQEIDSAGIALDRMGIAWDWRGGEPDTPDETELVEVFGPCGGAALYNRAQFFALGGFDPDFFMYLEDVDFAWRARLAGWRAVLQPQARLLHAHSASLGDASPLKRFLLGRNKVWMVIKNYPGADFWRYLPLLMGYDALAAAYGAVQWRDLAAARGRLQAYAQLGAIWRKRRLIQQRWQDVENWRRVIFPITPPWRVAGRYAHLAASGYAPVGSDTLRDSK